jgi:hypothetical protein
MADEETKAPVSTPAGEAGGGDAQQSAEAPPKPEKAPKPAKAPKAAKPAKPAKGAKDAKGKGPKGAAGKGGAGDGSAGGEGGRGSKLFLAEHPRAVRGVARAKAWGALTGFLVAGYLSLPTHTLPEAGIVALAAGSACYVAAWAGAVFLWRHLVVAELRAAQAEALKAELARVNRANPTAAVGRGAGAPAAPKRDRARAGV